METNLKSNIKIIDDIKKMDFAKVTQMLKAAYWSEGIGIDEVKQGAINSALVVGAFTPKGEQIGYVRAISDKTRFAYLLDAYVDEPFRKQGVGQAMIKFILNHPDLKDVYQWLLITKDAHGVYSGAHPAGAEGSFPKTRHPAACRKHLIPSGARSVSNRWKTPKNGWKYATQGRRGKN